MFSPRIRANKLKRPPRAKHPHQKFIPRSGSETNVLASPPASESKLVTFKRTPVRQPVSLFYTLYSGAREELDVYTESCSNDTHATFQFGRNSKHFLSFFVTLAFTQISLSLQPEIMTETKEPHRPDNEATVKIKVWTSSFSHTSFVPSYEL